jgi:type I restriction enzyme S subunit
MRQRAARTSLRKEMNHWPIRPLEEIAELYGGSTPSREIPKFWDGDIPWVTPTDLPTPEEGISVVSKTKERITKTGLDNSSATVVPAGTVLFSSRATIGKVAVAGLPLTTNQGFANFVPHQNMNSRFLAYALWVRRDEIAGLSGSTTFKEVSRSTLRQYKVPVPPLPEQERIVKLLDEGDRLRKLRVLTDRRTTSLVPTLFNEVFGDPVSNPKSWPQKRVRDIVRLINGRAFKSTEWGKTGLPIIRIQNLKDREAAFNFFEGDYEPKYFTRKGTILIAWAGQLVSFGVHIWNGPEGLLNQHIFRAEPLLEAENDYLQCALAHVVEHTKSRFHGIEMKHLTKGMLEETAIMVPPLPFQKEFAKRLTVIRRLQGAQASSRRRLEDLFQSLLYRAFRGEL